MQRHVVQRSRSDGRGARGRLVAVGTAGVALALGLAACGSSAPTATEKSFCGSLVTFDATSTPGGPSDPTPADMTDYGHAVTAPTQTMVANAPSTLASAATAVQAAVSQAVAGKTDALGDDYTAAKTRIETWAHDHCGFRRLDVRATDDAYAGVPKSLKAGDVAVQVRNAGKDPHLVLFVKRAAGDSRPALEVVSTAFTQLSSGNFDPSQGEKLGFLDGDPAFAAPGQTGATTVDLAAGRYVLFDPIGVGGNDADPHYAHGMVADLTVS